ncbi:pilin [Acinetobacter pecorum]|uniref:pilin n=1 Tax=Acinetobacter pecorum TaxID=2762215 RepID=UPI003EE74591
MQKGFTLIELMIVIAIVGVLSALAIASYFFFTLKTRLNTALYEVSSIKPAYEIIITQSSPTTLTYVDLNIKSETALCQIDIALPDYNTNTSKVLSCRLKNKSALQNNAEIYLIRNTTGQYHCKTIGILNYLIPTQCK